MVAEALIRLKVEEAIVADNEEEKEALIAEAIEYRTTLHELVSGNSTNRHLLYADGIIAFAKQDFRTAARKLEETINRNPDIDANVYRQAAFALSKTQQSIPLLQFAHVVVASPADVNPAPSSPQLKF